MGILHYIQHVAYESPGMVLDWAKERHIKTRGVFLHRGDPLPETEPDDLLVVMGGPMGIHDEQAFPWLRREKAYLFNALQSGMPVLGVCLGAQLIASVLGAKVVPCHYSEMGFSPIRLTREAADSPLFSDLPCTFTPLHWHSDTFTIPDGGVRIGGNDACMNQGFAGPGRVLALQFHLEATPDLAYAWLKETDPATFSGTNSEENKYVQDIEGLLESAMQFTPENRIILYTLLDRFFLERLTL